MKRNLGLVLVLLFVVFTTGCTSTPTLESAEEVVIIQEVNEEGNYLVVANYADEDQVKNLYLSDEMDINIFSVEKMMKVTYEFEEGETTDFDLVTFKNCTSNAQCGLTE